MAGFRWPQIVSGWFQVVSDGFSWFQVVSCISIYENQDGVVILIFQDKNCIQENVKWHIQDAEN